MSDFQLPADTSADKQQILSQSHQYLIPGRIQTFNQLGIDLVIGQREGYRFRDVDGKEFMDFHLNGGTYSLGHRGPALLKTLNQALENLDVGNHHFASPYRARLAEQLATLSPGQKLKYSVLTSSGSEANNVAIKSARTPPAAARSWRWTPPITAVPVSPALPVMHRWLNIFTLIIPLNLSPIHSMILKRWSKHLPVRM